MTFRASKTSIVGGFGSGIGRIVRSRGVVVGAPPVSWEVCALAMLPSQEPLKAVASAAFAVDMNKSRRFIWVLPHFGHWTSRPRSSHPGKPVDTSVITPNALLTP
jgi:hypothetical protein